MALNLRIVNATGTLADLQAAVSQHETLGFELLALARGVVGGAPLNTATFRNSPAAPGPLTLVNIDGSLALPDQQQAVSAGLAGGKTLICYAAVFIQGSETNIAAYRG